MPQTTLLESAKGMASRLLASIRLQSENSIDTIFQIEEITTNQHQSSTQPLEEMRHGFTGRGFIWALLHYASRDATF